MAKKKTTRKAARKPAARTAKKPVRKASKKSTAKKASAKKKATRTKPASAKKSAARRSTGATRRRSADPGLARAKGPVLPEDARLVLELYDLRREEVMRASRDALLRWRPGSLEELLEMSDIRHPMNAALRQVESYFELAFGLARRGAVHPELIAEWCGEGLLLYAKVQPFVEAFRDHPKGT
ncbi:MAG: hypothetical protein AAFP86_11045, partial [Planctomycetota bacterium]